jgi:hypothetical protein
VVSFSVGRIAPAEYRVTVGMGLGSHPQRTPFYGVLLVIGAVLLVWLAASVDSAWQMLTGYFLALVLGGVGFVMTLRDYDDFPHWRR